MPAVSLTPSLPIFASQEEHASTVNATPNSFSDILPVLHHQETNVFVTFDPALEGYESPVKGTLYILSSVLVFMPQSGPSGFQIKYPAITLHAISRGEPGPAVYCQLDEAHGEANGTPPNATVLNEFENGDTEMRELTIAPRCAEAVEAIFDALSRCASLHPDPLEDDGWQDDDEAFVDPSAFETFNGNEDQVLSEVGRAALDYMESIISDPQKLIPEKEETFEDAEETNQIAPPTGGGTEGK